MKFAAKRRICRHVLQCCAGLSTRLHSHETSARLHREPNCKAEASTEKQARVLPEPARMCGGADRSSNFDKELTHDARTCDSSKPSNRQNMYPCLASSR